MAGRKITYLAAAATALLGSAAALDAQRPFVASESEVEHAIVAAAAAGKPLVDTEKLQASITGENLVKRAKDLFKVAQLSEDEYNHPTRVIGSQGMFNSKVTNVRMTDP